MLADQTAPRPSTSKPRVAILMALGAISCARVISHDPEHAADTSIEFARLAFIRSESDLAFRLLARDVQRAASVYELGTKVRSMHPRAKPATVKAVGYEPMPGERMMTIWLEGSSEGETFYYRFVLSGERNRYHVQWFTRTKDPDPASALRRSFGARPSS